MDEKDWLPELEPENPWAHAGMATTKLIKKRLIDRKVMENLPTKLFPSKFAEFIPTKMTQAH